MFTCVNKRAQTIVILANDDRVVVIIKMYTISYLYEQYDFSNWLVVFTVE